MPDPSPLPSRTLTELDHTRLQSLLRRQPPDARTRAVLDELVDGADLVASTEIGPEVVTVYAQVVLADPRDGRPVVRVPCWPKDADVDAGFVSVLSPLGAALLGARVGDRVGWTTPDGEVLEADIRAITFQPEASGDYTL